MDLDRLKALITFAELRTVAATAGALQRSTTTVRRRIAELEAEVGGPLTVPCGRTLALTPAGELLVSEGRSLLAAHRTCLDRVRTNSTGVTGEFRLATQLGIPPDLAAGAIANHFRAFPGLRLKVFPVASPLEMLPDQADIAITMGPRPRSGQWLSAVLKRGPERVVASQGYLDRHGTPQDVEQLEEHLLMSWVPPGESPDLWPLRSGGTMEVRTSLASPDIVLVRRCMLMGMGLARVPDGLTISGIATGHVVPVLPDVIGRDVVVRVVVPDTDKMRGPFLRFVKSIRATAEEIDVA